MNVLLIGSGGREHALANAISGSPRLTKLFCAPGNPGIAAVAECVVLDVADHAAVVNFCRLMKIDLVVVGPEQPLVEGVADSLEAAGIACFGPSKAAAQLEGSKGFTKDLCAKAGIPTGAYGRFSDKAAALAYVRDKGAPIVVKADGLAAGKGVVVAMTTAEAEAAVAACFQGAFGAAGAEVVVEEFLEGEEASFFALCDGSRALALASAQDHKRVGDGDTGPNTGGMGAYSPAPVVTAEIERRVMAEIVEPTVKAMAAAGMPFKGVLFAGLMIGDDGPKLIEFNTRFGDPETQVILPRIADDLLTLLDSCARGKLEAKSVALEACQRAHRRAGRQRLSGGAGKGRRDPQCRQGRRHRRRRRHARRHEEIGRKAGRQRRARAQCDGLRRERAHRARQGLCGRGCDRISRRLLPARYRLARAGIAPAHPNTIPVSTAKSCSRPALPAPLIACVAARIGSALPTVRQTGRNFGSEPSGLAVRMARIMAFLVQDRCDDPRIAPHARPLNSGRIPVRTNTEPPREASHHTRSRRCAAGAAPASASRPR